MTLVNNKAFPANLEQGGNTWEDGALAIRDSDTWVRIVWAGASVPCMKFLNIRGLSFCGEDYNMLKLVEQHVYLSRTDRCVSSE